VDIDDTGLQAEGSTSSDYQPWDEAMSENENKEAMSEDENKDMEDMNESMPSSIHNLDPHIVDQTRRDTSDQLRSKESQPSVAQQYNLKPGRECSYAQ